MDYHNTESRRKLSPQDQSMINAARGIMDRIENGERVISSAAHLSEFANIVQRRAGAAASCEALSSLLGMDNIDFSDVDKGHYLLALEIAKESGVGVNDCLAAVLMSKNNSSEIYSFDTDFDRLGVRRIME